MIDDSDIDYSIPNRPLVRTLTRENENGEEEYLGTQMQGLTTFAFTPREECSREMMEDAIESVLERKEYEYGRGGERMYFNAAHTAEPWCSFDVAVQEDLISLYVKRNTLSEVVESFVHHLDTESEVDWGVTKHTVRNADPESFEDSL